ncbi:hypothetical protein WJ0W_005292 [Paenibacillus melissococcoides]|uniref:Uncharacterized protein n=1 Tax=Paenibacillus melissococcoides TaxID=2912268 RepID=A0ABN8UD55_9BACL|nr:hypothetical protein WJ0W_005292 [Paenibacillus melissococcoides]
MKKESLQNYSNFFPPRREIEENGEMLHSGRNSAVKWHKQEKNLHFCRIAAIRAWQDLCYEILHNFCDAGCWISA